MKKQFVTYEIALKLKELGFDEKCSAVYRTGRLYPILGFEKINSLKQSVIAAPLWQQVIDWFREQHLLMLSVFDSNTQNKFGFIGNVIFTYPLVLNSSKPLINMYYETYYEAREQMILKAIELCKK